MRRLWIQAANEAEYEEIEEWILYKLGPLGLLGDELPTVIQTADRLHVKELSPAYGVIGEAAAADDRALRSGKSDGEGVSY